MERVSTEVKLAIVERLATFQTPSEVAQAVNEAFGLALERQHIEKYDPTKRAGAELSPALKELFEEMRKRFVEGVTTIACANQRIVCARFSE